MLLFCNSVSLVGAIKCYFVYFLSAFVILLSDCDF